jgi:hypothetical protein
MFSEEIKNNPEIKEHLAKYRQVSETQKKFEKLRFGGQRINNQPYNCEQKKQNAMSPPIFQQQKFALG